MGPTGSGKSTFVRTVTKQKDITVGHDLTSSMLSFSSLWAVQVLCQSIDRCWPWHPATAEVQACHFRWKGRNYELVDTPGFDDTYTTNTDVLRAILKWMECSYKEGQRIHGLIYLHRISDPRLQGSAVQNLHIFRKICGHDCFRNVVLATTFWDLVDAKTGNNRETELTEAGGFWHDMIRQGSRVARLDLSRETCLGLLESFAQLHNVIPQAQEEVVMQSKSAEQTLVGRFIGSKEAKATRETMIREEKHHHTQMKLLAEDARRAQDHYTQKEEQRKKELATKARKLPEVMKAVMDADNADHRAQLAQLRKRGVKEREPLKKELNTKKRELASLKGEGKKTTRNSRKSSTDSSTRFRSRGRSYASPTRWRYESPTDVWLNRRKASPKDSPAGWRYESPSDDWINRRKASPRHSPTSWRYESPSDDLINRRKASRRHSPTRWPRDSPPDSPTSSIYSLSDILTGSIYSI